MSSITLNLGDTFSQRRRTLYIVVLGALLALGPLTVDLYLPALPAIASGLAAPTGLVQWTLAGTTIGFAVGQAVVGPLSDHFGRRRPLLISIGTHIASSVLVALAPTIGLLIVGRVVQGFGAAAGVVVALAIARDLYGGPPLVVLLSRLALVTGLAPIIAPVLGAQLVTVVGWRGIFVVLATYSCLVLIAVGLSIRETHPFEGTPGLERRSYRQRYQAVFRDRRFWGAAVTAGMTFTSLFAYLASSPFLFQSVFGFSAQQYGLVFAANSVGVVIGIQTAARLARRFDPRRIVAVALPLMASCLGVILVWGSSGTPTLVMACLFLYIMFGGLCGPSVQLIALRDHGRQSGTAASVLGIFSFGLAGILSPILGLFPIASAAPMAAYMLVAICVAMLSVLVLLRPWKSEWT